MTTSTLRRALTGIGIAISATAFAAPEALAHSEFSLDEAAPGSIINVELTVENESSTAGTTKIQLRFPQPIVIVDIPTVEGWTVTPVEGTIGAAAGGIDWERADASPDEDPTVALTIGPLPDTEGRLQFKVLQTYSDGTEDAWIQEWPVGAEEPDRPGPYIDLVAGAAGTIPETTVPAPTTELVAETAPSSTEAPAVTTAASTATTVVETTTTTPAADTTPTTVTGSTPTTETNDDSDSSAGTIVIVIIGVAVIAGAAAFSILRMRRRRP